MKIENRQLKVIKGGGDSSVQFRIAGTAKAFEILSSGLYSDKIAAICRELGTNAHDGHVKANKADVPFKVHLPNEMEPYFMVKDEGSGLSHEEVCTIYTTYFESDKTDSDDFTGCLGLGSKSPFCYTDQFSITAVKDGVKNVYTAFINESGCPEVVRLSESKTDEGNGVEIQIPVKRQDYREWLLKATKVYQWFKTRPIVTGNPGFSYPQAKNFLIETETYGFTLAQCQSHVVMGNVAYPFEQWDFDEKTRNSLTEVETIIMDHGVYLFMPIGSVQVAASREKLQMTPRTVKKIRNAIAEVAKGVEAEARKMMRGHKSFYDAQVAYNHFIHNTVIGNIFKQLKADPIVWNNKPLTGMVNMAIPITTKDEDGTLKEELVKNDWQANCRKYLMSQRRRRRRRYSYSDDISNGMFESSSVSFVKVTQDAVWFVDDLGHGAIARLKLWMKDNSESHVYVLKPISEADADQEKFKNFLKDNDLESRVQSIASLPKPMRNGRQAGMVQKQSAKAVRFTGLTEYATESVSWEDHTIEDIDVGGVYVEVARYKWRCPRLQEHFVSPYHGLEEVYKLVNKLSSNPVQLIGIRSTLLPRIDKNPNWIRLDDYLANLLQIHAKDAAFYQDVVDVGQALVYETSKLLSSLEDYEFSPKSVFNQQLMEIRAIHSQTTGQILNIATVAMEALHKYKNLCEVSLPKSRKSHFQDAIETVAKHYPMLGSWFVSYSNRHVNPDHLAIYINAIDQGVAAKKFLKKVKAAS